MLILHVPHMNRIHFLLGLIMIYNTNIVPGHIMICKPTAPTDFNFKLLDSQ